MRKTSRVFSALVLLAASATSWNGTLEGGRSEEIRFSSFYVPKAS